MKIVKKTIVKNTIIALMCMMALASSVIADDFRPLFRGIRAQGMGNAFTAIADDEQAIFYNPAGLAGVKNFSFVFGSGSLDVSNDLVTGFPTYLSAVSNLSLSSLNAFVGKDIYARAQGISAVTVPGFGMAVIYDQQMAVRLKNQSLPQGVIGSQTTYGFQMGFGTAIAKLKRKRGELRFGVAGKVLWRLGGYQSPSLTQVMALDSKSIMNNFAGKGIGYGIDSGFQFVYNFRKTWSLLSGLSFTDIGSTSFSSGADPQRMNSTFGLGVKYKGPDMTMTIAYDFSRIFDNVDWPKKSHLGAEFRFPMISVYAGLNQVSFTYGFGLDLWLFKLMYVSYGDSLGTLAGQDIERRSMVNLAMKFDL
jgi:hypothetical protein